MQTSGNTVLITGGSAGIGLAFAQRFCQEGNRVIITGRNLARLQQVQQLMPGIEVVQADMADRDALQDFVANHPDVNVLANNAGVQYNYQLQDESIPLDRIQSEIDINLTGPLQLIKLYLPHLTKHPSSAIINVTSSLGIVPKQSASVYCGTKAGLHMATKALRWQLEDTPIQVFEVIPSLVDTDMTAGRGQGKISPEKLVDECWQAFQRDQYEISVGAVKQLRLLNRFFPSLAEKILKAS